MDEWLQDNDWGDLSCFKSQHFSLHWSTRGSETHVSIWRKETLQWPWLIIGFKLLFLNTRCHLGLSLCPLSVLAQDYWLLPPGPCCHSDQWDDPRHLGQPIRSQGLMRIRVLCSCLRQIEPVNLETNECRFLFFYNYSVTFYVIPF